MSDTITVAVIAAMPPTLIGFFSFLLNRKNSKAIEQVHISINSRMDSLLKATKGEAVAEGREIGRAERTK